jgi:hypothetical protein
VVPYHHPGVPAPTLLQQLEVSASTGSPNRNWHSKDYRSMVFQAQSICNSLMDRSLIDTYVEVARSLSRGVPGPTLLVQQLKVSVSTCYPSQTFHSKDYRSMVFQAQSICNSLMDRSLIDTYVEVVQLLSRGVPGPTLLVQQLEVSASTGSQSQTVHSKDYRSMVFKPNQYAIA